MLFIIQAALAALLVQDFLSFCSGGLQGEDVVESTDDLAPPACGNCRLTDRVVGTPTDRHCPDLRDCQRHTCLQYQTGIVFRCRRCLEWPGLTKWHPCDDKQIYHDHCATCQPPSVIDPPWPMISPSDNHPHRVHRPSSSRAPSASSSAASNSVQVDPHLRNIRFYHFL
ncbi:hypothetical protein PGT21_011998 [Puccinia graminis f. sp. tritici]|uniref:Uncharacterized protein n=2 Tax=Puccinia graminis f. sp. tritici TaxID=56615 RepID=E3KFL6_PUCGT|nr:uncharacterized protein PGTG_09033 [Puccinia graminis f. sp. tritici CRL 75-36-700-3]EFP83080.2 hypothetical protein PGTG_09033 [Puccinia graminis f. sp. tritici CRL 75-36-700-3]KAA1089223.1 hypothetical protein PGT21_010726 [Puccinia graminis f. sp. tritici]KAA1092714.1 hypothetical protein PGT21_011998 [Puccinia graminis f. sp. tritici]KAA1093814.1 hypothetical protein PGTUg99_030821 [Puccinia graminis f. sp. tritici]